MIDPSPFFMTQRNGLNGEKPLVSATIGEIIGPNSYCPFQLIKSHHRANVHSDYNAVSQEV